MHIFDKFTAYAEDSTEYVVIQERRTHATLAKPDGYVDTFSLEATGEVLSLHSDNIKIFRINSTDTLIADIR